MMKNLDKDAVLKTAESLLTQYGNTTTLDVKNRLRNNGYQAFQADVSNWMDLLAKEENWSFTHNGSYKIFRFGPDTHDTLKKYLEKDGEFWEIQVEGKTQTICTAKVGQDGTPQSWNFPTNRKAMTESQNLLQVKINAGFTEAIDTRLPLTIRKKYGQYFNQKPIKCKLGYYNLKKIEKQACELIVQGEKKQALLHLESNAGYDFFWNSAESLSKVNQILHETTWDYKIGSFDEMRLTGEKLLQKQVQIDDQILEMNDETLKPLGQKQLDNLLMTHQLDLYGIEFTFESGEKVKLSKFELNWQDELLPIAQRILG